MKKVKLPKKEKKVKKVKEKKSIFKTLLSGCLLIAIIGISIGLLFALYIVITSPDFLIVDKV